MSKVMEEEFKRWTAKRKAALVMEIIQGKTTVAEASRSFGLISRLQRSKNGSMKVVKGWRTPCVPSPWMFASSTNGNSRSCRKPKEKPCWSCAPEKNWRPCWARKTSNRDHPPGTQTRRFRCGCQQDLCVVWDCQAQCLLQAGEGGAQGAGALCRTHSQDDPGRAVLRLSHGGWPARVQ